MLFPNWMTGDAPINGSVCSIRMLSPDDGGGGGGGDGGKKDDPPKDDGGEPSEATQKFITDTINKAIGGRVKREVNSLKDSLNETIGTTIKDALAANKPDDPPDGGKGGGGGDGGGGQSDEMKAMEARVKASEDRAKAVELERKDEREQGKRTAEKSALESALRTAKVSEALVPAATSLLFTDRKIVGRDDKDGIIWKAARDGYNDELSLTDGVAEFLATEEGKAYLPPIDAKGGGVRGGGKKPGGNVVVPDGDKMTKGEALDILGEGLLDSSGGAFRQ